MGTTIAQALCSLAFGSVNYSSVALMPPMRAMVRALYSNVICRQSGGRQSSPNSKQPRGLHRFRRGQRPGHYFTTLGENLEIWHRLGRWGCQILLVGPYLLSIIILDNSSSL